MNQYSKPKEYYPSYPKALNSNSVNIWFLIIFLIITSLTIYAFIFILHFNHWEYFTHNQFYPNIHLFIPYNNWQILLITLTYTIALYIKFKIKPISIIKFSTSTAFIILLISTLTKNYILYMNYNFDSNKKFITQIFKIDQIYYTHDSVSCFFYLNQADNKYKVTLQPNECQKTPQEAFFIGYESIYGLDAFELHLQNPLHPFRP